MALNSDFGYWQIFHINYVMSALEALSVDDSRARLVVLRTADKIQDVLELFGR